MTDSASMKLRRRSFLACCGGLGLGSGLFPGALWAQSEGGTATITSDMIDAAARLAVVDMPFNWDGNRTIDVYLAPHPDNPDSSATSLSGHPAISVPNGFDEDGKPTGILFVGKLYGEAEIMIAARAYQDANDFHQTHPVLE